MMRKPTLLLLCLLPAITMLCQEIMNLDSLLKLVPQAKKDSGAVNLYISIGQQYENNEPQTAKAWYQASLDLSRQVGYSAGIIRSISNYTYILNMKGLYDSSLVLNSQAVAIARTTKDTLSLAKALFNTGTSYRMLSQFDNAIRYYDEGGRIFARMGNEMLVAQSYDLIQSLYSQLHQFEKGVEFGEKGLALMRSSGNNSPMLGSTLINLGGNYVSLRMFDKAQQVFDEALSLSERTDDKNLAMSAYLNLGDLLIQKGRYELIRPYMEKALVLAKDLESSESEAIALKGLAFYYLHRRDLAKSEENAKQALALTLEYGLNSQRAALYTHFSNLAYANRDMELGEYYAIRGSQLTDSLLNETIARSTVELEQKYEAEKKQLQIVKLEIDKKDQQYQISRKDTLNALLIAGAVVLVVLLLLLYRNYQQKQKLQQQRITELEAEKQLAATEAVLKGEEIERTRLARDLHDGLGGMLSGIKYSLNTMKGNMIMTPENAQAFERSIDMLDSSIKEMRRVAHNMMPEALVKFGLDEALKDFCNDVNQTGAIAVSYQSIGLKEEIIEQTKAITIYRIVQELINNTMKHAAATNALVQVTKTDGLISVTVEDDGKGFDTAILERAKGIGWSNIQNRVEFLKGKMDVSSGEGKGTSVLIEISLH